MMFNSPSLIQSSGFSVLPFLSTLKVMSFYIIVRYESILPRNEGENIAIEQQVKRRSITFSIEILHFPPENYMRILHENTHSKRGHGQKVNNNWAASRRNTR